jgi:hypothetical protein
MPRAGTFSKEVFEPEDEGAPCQTSVFGKIDPENYLPSACSIMLRYSEKARKCEIRLGSGPFFGAFGRIRQGFEPSFLDLLEFHPESLHL